jgi:hypothetical protein
MPMGCWTTNVFPQSRGAIRKTIRTPKNPFAFLGIAPAVLKTVLGQRIAGVAHWPFSTDHLQQVINIR